MDIMFVSGQTNLTEMPRHSYEQVPDILLGDEGHVVNRSACSDWPLRSSFHGARTSRTRHAIPKRKAGVVYEIPPLSEKAAKL